jgi:hypothetical protein
LHFKFNSNGDKIWEPIFFRNYKRICFKNGEIYFTGTTGINNPSISTPNAYQEDNHGWVQAYLENFDNDGKENGARFMVVSTVEVREMLRRLTIMAYISSWDY